MRKMILAIVIINLFCFCNNNQNVAENIQVDEQDLKKYHITTEDINNGIVRVYSITIDDTTETMYRVVMKKSDNKFCSQDYDGNFNQIGENIYQIHDYGFDIFEMSIFRNSFKDTYLTKYPLLYSYSSKDSITTGIYELVPNKCMKIEQIINQRLIKNDSLMYNDQAIDCIVFELKWDMIFYETCESLEQKKSRLSYTYYGENLGLVKSETKTEKGMKIMKLTKIITIDKFNKIKNNS